MTINTWRTLLAFLVAPVFAVLFVPVGACLVSFVGARSCDVDFGWAPIFVGVAYVATLIAGVPLYLMLMRLDLRSWGHFGLAGVAVGLVAATIIKLMDAGFAWSGLALIVTPIGFLVGVLFLGVSSARKRAAPPR